MANPLLIFKFMWSFTLLTLILKPQSFFYYIILMEFLNFMILLVLLSSQPVLQFVMFMMFFQVLESILLLSVFLKTTSTWTLANFWSLS